MPNCSSERLAMTHPPSSAVWNATQIERAGEIDTDARRLLVRGLTVVGLAGIALIHLVELPDTWRESPGLGALFLVLVIAAVVVGGALVHQDATPVWQLSALVALGPIVGYVVTRSADLPFDHDDVGNWLEPSVLVATFIEVSVLALCAYALLATKARSARL
jgi:hypothetical protein